MQMELGNPPLDEMLLFTDLYELSMAQAYWNQGLDKRAVFSLFFRELPENRNFMLACGQQHLGKLISQLRFPEPLIAELAELGLFKEGFLDWLRHFRFSGDIHALPEGTPVFPNEPILEVDAPIAQAQLLESLIMNYIHVETVLASKAVRLVLAAGDIPVIDFGMRRMHGVDAAMRGVRAYHTAGLAGTSNVLGGLTYDVPIRGTMAHSFVQAYDDEDTALKAFTRLYPGTTLLVDTYDAIAAVKRMTKWLRQEEDLQVGAIRLDSGDPDSLSRECRKLLDEAGFEQIRIVVSGGLDEFRIRALKQGGAPIDGIGVGTAIGVAQGAPSLDLAYKLTEYAGKARMKDSPGKQTLPGRKQLFRSRSEEGLFTQDRIGLREETCDGEPMLKLTVVQGNVVSDAIPSVDAARDYARHCIQSLPGPLRKLEQAPAYPIQVTPALKRLQQQTLERLH